MQRKLARWVLNKRDIYDNPKGKYPDKIFKVKPCRYCKTDFQPVSPSHLYCSDECAANGITHNYYLRQYGLSLKQVEQMLEKQNHCCAICKEAGFKINNKVYSTLNVDHCHDTGNVRGLLCHNCNRALGLFKDDTNRLKTAITYLEGATTISKESTLK